MTQVIDFYFSVLSQGWALIVSQWILSSFVLVLIIGWVVSLINNSMKR